MEEPVRRVKDTPKRVREVRKYLRSTHSGVDLSQCHPESSSSPWPPEGHIPLHSQDPTLTAFAQLGALRLNSARAMISFLDNERQYILAEATATSPLRHEQSVPNKNALWLGNTCVSRKLSVCQRLLDGSATRNDGSVIIPDLLCDSQFGDKWFVSNGPRCRYYAGAPIVSQDGYVIGVYCIFDDKPRLATPTDDLVMLQNLASITMQYFDSQAVREDNERAEVMVRGLSSFVQGADCLQVADTSPDLVSMTVSAKMNGQPTPLRSGSSAEVPAHSLGFQALLPRGELSTAGDRNPSRSQFHPKTSPGFNEQAPIPDIAIGSLFSTETEELFSRAANIIKQCCNLDGVVFFDALSAGTGSDQNDPSRRHQHLSAVVHAWDESSTSSSSSSLGEVSIHPKPELRHSLHLPSSTAETDTPRPQSCRIIGYATGKLSGSAPDSGPTAPRGFPAADLRWLLRKHPEGGIMYFTAAGELLGTDELELGSQRYTKADREKLRTIQVGRSIRSVAAGARSAAFLPLWDYERSRWFAACVLWTTESSLMLSPKVELLYLRAFGNSIMTELSRLDARASDKMKTTFVASISHELRTPLHGILGGAEFLKDSTLSFFQTDMLNSIESCSLTLLDIVNHVLDYSKINEFRKNTDASSADRRMNQSHASAVMDQKRQEVDSLTTPVDLSAILEEVVETAFAGQSFALTSARFDHEHWDHNERQSKGTDGRRGLPNEDISQSVGRKQVQVLLDIPKRDTWTYHIPLGAWRRIVMNVVGNALKYTNSGYVVASLQAVTDQSSEPCVKLVVSDTGVGMSAYFVQNKLFMPFSQENSLSVGTGLGLNIVRQLVDAIGGLIDIRSQQGSGTTVSISIPIVAANKPEPMGSMIIKNVTERLKILKIGILEPFRPRSDRQPSTLLPQSAIQKISSARFIKQTLEQWLGIQPHYCCNQWDGTEVDVIFCTEPSFEALAAVRANRRPDKRASVVLFLAMDGFETATLRNDSRVMSKESVVEIMTQPCGPRKLAKALNHALDRYASASENVTMNDASNDLKAQGPPEPTDLPPHHITPPVEGLPKPTSSFNSLVVDDNPINRRLLVTFLKKKGLPYWEAKDGLEALTMYKAASPIFNLIFMDMSMPVMDGMTSTSEIRKYERLQRITPATIVAVTGLASATARVEAMNSGVDAFLTKPLKLDVLAPFIEVRNEKKRRI